MTLTAPEITVAEAPPVSGDPAASQPGSAEASATEAPSTPSASQETAPPARGLAQPVMTTDSAAVGRLFVVCSLILALGAAVIEVLLSIARTGAVDYGDLFAGTNAYFQMWTLYRVSLVVLVVLPLLLGVALAVVPSQVGAVRVAFPRAALASFWCWLIAAVLIVASVFAGGGWGALDGVTANESDAIALTLLGTALAVVALLLGAITVATTVISLRRRGMSLLDVPPFSWSMLVASVAWLFTLPVAVANIALIYADLRGRPAVAFGRAESPDIWLQLDWLFEQPAVYIMVVPVLGIAFDAVSSALDARSSRPAAVAVVIGLFGLLAVGGWSQDYFTAPQDLRDGLVYVAFGLAAVVPVLACGGGVAELVMRGNKSLDRLTSVPMFAAAAALKLLGAAVVVGALRVVEPFDLLESTATWAVFHGVVLAALVAAVAALTTWAPQLQLPPIPNNAGRTAIALILLGGALLVLPDAVLGFLSESHLMALALDGPAGLNVLVLVGSLLVALGLAAVVAALLQSLKPAAETPSMDGA